MISNHLPPCSLNRKRILTHNFFLNVLDELVHLQYGRSFVAVRWWLLEDIGKDIKVRRSITGGRGGGEWEFMYYICPPPPPSNYRLYYLQVVCMIHTHFWNQIFHQHPKEEFSNHYRNPSTHVSNKVVPAHQKGSRQTANWGHIQRRQVYDNLYESLRRPRPVMMVWMHSGKKLLHHIKGRTS